ncbi:MAG: PD-(D/E)XK nuclease family protein [Balneolaceae bacterium]|nr:PD-(D/E)XK nuclease family protein [Balneolaceae bacterium]
MANQSIAIEPFKKLISEYKKLDPIPERESTIFEISGYPHFEEVISNVMAFFFRTDEKHSFSSVFVESLLAAANTLNDDLPSSFAVEKVEREVLTNTGNRIDLVIETDSVCIAIENKIYANLYNNLNDYQDFIEARYPEHKRMFLYYLSEK